MSDPRDDEQEPTGTPEDPSEDLDQVLADSEESGGKGRPALNDEIARRWDPARLVRSVASRSGGGQQLDMSTRGYFERKLGVDLGDVRLYSGDFAEKLTKQHQAEAVTVGGTGMIFMSGTPDRSPATSAGRALLAHELTHVAQASRGVYRSAPGQDAPLSSEAHEAEAEQMEALELAGGAPGGDQPTPQQSHEALVNKVLDRVAEMLYEDERIEEIRNGSARTRS